jgi:hypothetical protein
MFWMDTDVYGAKLPLEIFPRAEDHTIFVLYNFLEYSMKYKILEIKKAETVGFEPTCPKRTTAFRVRLVMTTSIRLHKFS